MLFFKLLPFDFSLKETLTLKLLQIYLLYYKFNITYVYVTEFT